MSRSATTNASRGEHRGGRHPVRPVRVRHLPAEAPRDSGAPAYISTLAPVIMPTSERQLGNGSRKSSPNRNAKISPTHGTPLALTRPKNCGAYRFLARP